MRLIDVIEDPYSFFPHYRVLVDLLKAADIEAEAVHSGGGIFGLETTTANGFLLFIGDRDEVWGADVQTLEPWGSVGSEYTEIPTDDPEALTRVVSWVVDLFSRVSAGRVPAGLDVYRDNAAGRFEDVPER